MYNYIFVGGRFGPDQKPSGYVGKLFSALHSINPNGLLVNGGKAVSLEMQINVFKRIKYDVIFWMPDVDNDEYKWVEDIKKNSPHSILITSKNNIEGWYNFLELVSRALKVKANLCLEITKNEEGLITSTLFDPLGNQYCKTDEIPLLAVKLATRIYKLLKFTRMGSRPYPALEVTPPDAPDAFYDIVRNYADVFHKCIHGVDTTRMLGNASFRCERGFPSFKSNEGLVYVSQRNIDKRFIAPENFVPVCLVFSKDKNFVGYVGDNKPSVDTPIQLMLYHYFHNIRYMIHSHTYIESAPFTDSRIPCGAVEEFYDIIKVFPYRDETVIKINLLGHGSIVMAKDLSRLQDIKYCPKNNPEVVSISDGR